MESSRIGKSDKGCFRVEDSEIFHGNGLLTGFFSNMKQNGTFENLETYLSYLLIPSQV